MQEFTSAEQKRLIEQYQLISFANLKRSILNDLRNNADESVLYRRYKKGEVVDLLKNPQKNEQKIRELSCYLYIVSSHYRRLVDYYAHILLYNYNVDPLKTPLQIVRERYLEAYLHTIRECEKYNLRHEAIKAMKIAVRDGIFFGICYESEDSFYIKPVNSKWAQISGVEDGAYTFEFDLNYFNSNKKLLPMYGTEFVNAYDRYKGNPERGIEPDKTRRWYEPKNGICIKVDESDPYYSLPLFMGLLTEIFDIEDAKMLQKAKKENDNYKALGAKVPTDNNGVPLLPFNENKEWFDHIVENIDNDGIGVFMSPFQVTDYSFASSKTSDVNDVIDAQENFWMTAGTSSLIFGSAKATSSSSLALSVKPDEQIAYSILLQFQRYFNKKLKKMGVDYVFKIEFTRQSIFNGMEYVDKLAKAAASGLPVKTDYAISLGLSPSDMWNKTILEEEILELATKRWVTPLIANSTVSHSDSEGGCPTAEERGEIIGEAGEQTREIDADDNR